MTKTKVESERVESERTITIPCPYSEDEVSEMSKLKGFQSIEEMVEFFLNKQMGLFYEGRKSQWQ